MKEIIRIQSISEVHDFLGFPKPKHPLVSVLPINDKMTNFDYGDATYIFDFYQISMKSGVSGSLTYGVHSYDFQEGMMLFMKPNQTLRIDNNEQSKGSTGWTLLFHPDLLRKSPLGKMIDEYSFFNYEIHEALYLSEDEKQSVLELIQKIEKEYNQHIDKHSQDLIITNIELLLKYSKRYYDRQFFTRTNVNKDIISSLEHLIQDYYKTNKPEKLGVLSVAYCAKELNMSSNYLGDLIKNETGKSVKEHLQDYLINQAKNQIIGSNETIREIAYNMGFEYPQSFNKLFKAKTGMSPLEYRNLN